MINKNIFLEVKGETINNIGIKSKIKHKFFKDQISKNILVNIKNRNVYIIIEDEEVHIKHLSLPKVNKKYLNSLIKNHLIYLYGKKSEDIFYTYKIYKEKDNHLEILLFCINCRSLNNLEEFLHKNNVKKINLLQFCVINFFQKYIKDKNYIMIFSFNESLYMLALVNNKLVSNKVLKKSYRSEYSIVDELEYILEKLVVYKTDIKNIYYFNYYNRNLINYCIKNKFKYTDLGAVEEKEIIKYFMLKRKKL